MLVQCHESLVSKCLSIYLSTYLPNLSIYLSACVRYDFPSLFKSHLISWTKQVWKPHLDTWGESDLKLICAHTKFCKILCAVIHVYIINTQLLKLWIWLNRVADACSFCTLCTINHASLAHGNKHYCSANKAPKDVYLLSKQKIGYDSWNKV